ncbi:MAG: NADH:flavin oxidoreductase/NADH oxidase [Parachlamydiales bacterium]|jgi:2,4-dienoyl-CoA reductase-like NADH-dependent reductase (Old Yellow Enzyme family)
MTEDAKDTSVHGCSVGTDHDREVPEVDLFSPLTLRGITFKNRIVMSPMCQYSAENGMANDWHLVHLGSRAAGGVALVMVEATAVTSEGRISPKDMGLWSDAHIEPLSQIAAFVAKQGAIPGIQLAHAGRKGSSLPPWQGGTPLKKGDNGSWDLLAPSAIPFDTTNPVPKEMNEADIQNVIQAFKDSVQRALKAGFKVIEIHSAHGYLLHEFLSPISNKRTDQYGGSLENRMRLPLQVAVAARELIPEEYPLFVRISASDWIEGGWDIVQSVELSKKLKNVGVDLIDVSSGGMVPNAKIPVGKGYQVPFAQQIREQAEIRTGAVGLILEPRQAEEILTQGSADLIFLGRELLREPYWVIKAQHELGFEPDWPTPYGYAVKRRSK